MYGEKKKKRMEKRSQNKDKLLTFKRLGYIKAFLNTPENAFDTEIESSINLKDFIAYVKFQLGLYYKIPSFSSYWDDFTDELLMTEYYALLFSRSEDEKNRFLSKVAGADPDWMDKMGDDNKKAIEEYKRKMAKNEDLDLDFDPNKDV